MIIQKRKRDRVKQFIISTLFALSCIYAQDRIAIVEFSPSGIDNITAKNITNRFSYELSKTKKFEIVEREMMDKILDEQKFQSSGCVVDECAVEIGQILGVQLIVAGNISKIENFYSLNVRFIDVETGKILYQDMQDHEGKVSEFLQVTVKNMALRMAAETTKKTDTSSGLITQYSTTNKGTVVFNINQNDVAIFVDGKYSSRSSGKVVTLSLAEGTHNITFKLDGYRDWEKEFNILSDQVIPYDVEMVPGTSQTQEINVTGILLVRSEPINAKVFVDGVDKGVTLLQLTDIGVGEHEIRLEKNLYYSYSEIVNISPDAIEEVDAVLKPNFGKLSIDSSPTDAVIMIDGQIKGKTPYTINQIKSGSYNIQLSKDLYHTYEENFIITDGSDNERDIQLTPAFGKLSIVSNPVGAEVFIDGQSRGKTPFELDEFPSGKYFLRVSYALYETIEKEIFIEDGQTNYENLRLEARSGTLTLTGNPKGASIIVNDERIGTIPVNDYRLAEGMIEIKIEADNFHSRTEYLNIKRDQSYPLNIDLEHHKGKLIVISEPPDANVFLDNKSEGKTPIVLNEILTGKHHIEIQHPDYLPQTEDFSLALDEKKELRYKLITYAGSIQQKIDKVKFNQKLSMGGTLAFAALGLITGASAEKSYDSYLSAGLPSEAGDHYDRSALLDAAKLVCYGISGAIFIGYIKYTVDVYGLNKKLSTSPFDEDLGVLEYYNNGQKKSERTFKGGMQIYTEWYENGQMKAEERKWIDQLGSLKFLNLLSTEWDENGNEISRMENSKPIILDLEYLAL